MKKDEMEWGGGWQGGGRRGAYRVLWGELSERRHLEEQDIEKMKLLKMNFKK